MQNLKNNHQTNTNNSSADSQNTTSTEKLIKLKLTYHKETLLELNEINNVNEKDKLFMKHKEKLIDIINAFQTKINFINNITMLQQAYNEYQKIYQNQLLCYAHDIWQSSSIYIWGLECYCTLKDFRDAYLITFNNQLNKKVNKFKNYQYYDEIEKLLLSIREGYALACLYGNINIETAQVQLENHIIYETNGYTLRKKQLEELKFDKNINKEIIESLEKKLVFEEQFNEIYNQIDNHTKFKCKIKSYFNIKLKKEIKK